MNYGIFLSSCLLVVSAFAADAGKKRTTYSQGDERNTDPAGTAPKPELPKKKGKVSAKSAQGAQARSLDEHPTDDSGQSAWVPKDHAVDLPAPSQQESLAVLRQATEAARTAQSAVGGEASLQIGLRLLSAAYHFLGIPYQDDGMGDCVHGIDCSKLTRCAAIRARLQPTSFQAMAGIQYGYALKRQYNMAMVSSGSLKDAQPGDFLFFNYRNQFCAVRPYNVGHVALYIGPNKNGAMYVIEAGDPVQKRWVSTKYLVGVGRIIRDRPAGGK